MVNKVNLGYIMKTPNKQPMKIPTGTPEKPEYIDATLGASLVGGLSNLTNTDDAVRTFRLVTELADSGIKEWQPDDDKLDYIIKQVEKIQAPPMMKGQILVQLQDARTAGKTSS